MLKRCYIAVSNAALCQRCPMLLAYMIHWGQRDAWKVGINGKGKGYYGSLFHKNIAQVFFQGASDPASPLHAKIARALSERDSLEAMIRGEIFIPFLERNSENFSSGQIMAMARGISVWVRAMSKVFAAIPSLMRDPAGNMNTVFIPPEQKLKAHYDCQEGRLVVAGQYDALLFNPDKTEARLFEFKGYTKSDVTVPLSQSLIYSWLVREHTGITPSVEIIYLDDDEREPEIFSPRSVSEMICAGLPGLFRRAFGIISLKYLPEFARNERLCGQCPYKARCADDWRNLH